MITIIFAMLGASLVLGAFAAGWHIGGRRVRPQPPELPGETERERLQREQQAFRVLMSYSPETAYGGTLPGEEV